MEAMGYAVSRCFQSPNVRPIKGVGNSSLIDRNFSVEFSAIFGHGVITHGEQRGFFNRAGSG
jgi:hypothetical protein